MRYVIFTDRGGYKRRSLVRDGDGDEKAESGLPSGPPEIELIDWELVKRQINNSLVDAGVFDLDDLQRKGGIEIAANIVKRHVMLLYRTAHRETRQPVLDNSQE